MHKVSTALLGLLSLAATSLVIAQSNFIGSAGTHVSPTPTTPAAVSGGTTSPFVNFTPSSVFSTPTTQNQPRQRKHHRAKPTPTPVPVGASAQFGGVKVVPQTSK